MKLLYRMFVFIYMPLWMITIATGALYGTLRVGFFFGKDLMEGNEPEA